MEENMASDAIDTHIAIKAANKQEPKKELRKVFKGKTEFVLDYSTPEKLEASKQDRHFHQRMLRAYLKGQTVFNFGFTRSYDGRLRPVEHKVLIGWE